MAIQGIGTGLAPNDGNGDNLLAGALKINDNFNEIYTLLGDGSSLTSGIVTSIIAGTNITVSGSTGAVTINSTASGGGGEFVWKTTDVGINTTSNVGIGSTGPTSKLDVVGNAKFTGVVTATTFVGNLTGDVSGGATQIYLNTSTTNSPTTGSWLIPFVDNPTGSNRPVYVTGVGWGPRWFNPTKSLYVTNDTTVNQTPSAQSGYTIISPNSITIGQNVSIEGSSGIVTAISFVGDGSQLTGVSTANIRTSSLVVTGVSTFNSVTNFNSTTNFTGVSTFISNVSIGGTISVDGAVKLITNNATIAGTSGSTGEIKRIAGTPFFYDGSAWREFVLSSGTPVSVPADTEWDNVILRSTYDTASPDFFDFKFSEQPVKTGTGATTVASPVKIGTRSFRNNGVIGAGISYAYRAEHDFTGPWTIEFWINHDARPYPSNAYAESMVSQISLTSQSNNWSFGIQDNNIYGIDFLWFNNAKVNERVLHSVLYSTFDNDFISKWNHYALVRESSNGSLHFYINGYEVGITTNNSVIDNDITSTNGAGLHIGGAFAININGEGVNSANSIDAHFDDLRITTDARYVSVGNTATLVVGIATTTTALPTTGTLSSYVQPPGDKYGEIVLGGSPTWRGTSGVTVSQQSSGNYRVSFASTYTNSNDYFVLSHPMDQGFASYVGVARSTTHVDFAINKESDNTAVNTGSLSVQITNHN
jgi:hypothetical protein